MATDLVGFVAAFCTTVAFLPQAIKCIQTGDTASISLWMYVIFTVGVFLWLAYGVLLGNTVIIVANVVTGTLASLILLLKIRNDYLRRGGAG